MKKKILFTDLDYTLLDSNKQISEENMAAINTVLDAGHSVVVCTGRPFISADPQVKRLGLEKPGCYAICFNGGMVYDCATKEILYRKPLQMEYARYVFDKAEEFGLNAVTYDTEKLLCRHADDRVQAYISHFGISYLEDETLPETMGTEPVKVLIPADKERVISEKYMASIADWARDKVSVFYSSQSYIEHVSLGVSKGNAVRFLCDYMGVDISDTVGAGDAENDIPLLEAVGVGCAVANAMPGTKAVADYIADADCDHSAVAEIVRKFVLE